MANALCLVHCVAILSVFAEYMQSVCVNILVLINVPVSSNNSCGLIHVCSPTSKKWSTLHNSVFLSSGCPIYILDRKSMTHVNPES